MATDPMNQFKQLADQARLEKPDEVDVTHSVLATLRAQRAFSVPREPEYWIVGIGSFAVACAFLIAFWFSSHEDLLVMLTQPFITVMQ